MPCAILTGAFLTSLARHATRMRMSEQAKPVRPVRLLPRIVAVAFVATVAILAIASWDVSRGRVPVTSSPLVEDLLRTPEERRCDRDVSAVVTRHLPVGMTRVEAIGVLERARVQAPEPWFWRPTRDDRIRDQGAEISFTRVIRFTSFGNQLVTGTVAMDGDQVRTVSARMTCPFNG